MAEKCIMSSSQSILESWMTKQKSCWNTSRSCFKVPVFSVPLQLLPMLDKDNDICLDKDISVTSDLATSSPFRGLTCNTCGLQFQSHEEQQAHFKSNVHLVNVKRKMIGKSAISDKDEIEETVDVPLDEGESSDSSEDEGDANDSGNEEHQDRTGKQSYACSAGSVIKQNSAQRGSTFHVRDVQLPDWEIVLSAGAFPSSSALNGRDWADGDRDGGSKSEPHRVISAQLRVLQSNPICAVFLLRSGRFAGAIFNGTNLLIHKVMRRYTVRAKAGGGQSSHDNKSGKAKSAGAMLRRHGEQALREDVAECLRLWTGHIQSCSLILISAPKTMRGDLFVEEATTGSSSAGGGMVLCKDDARIRNVPFMVARPTLDEAKAVYDRCTSVYFNRVDSATEATTADPAGLSEELSVPKVPSAVRKERDVSPEPWSLTCAASVKIITACSAGDEEAAVSVIREVAGDGHQLYDVPHPSAQADPAAPTVDSMDLATVVNMVDSLESMSTALHIAARQGMAHAVYVLLELGASPLSADIRGRTAYFLAKDKDTRDAFRRYRGTEEGQDRWDWSAAGVGAALTEEAERMQKQREKDKEKEKKKRAAQRKKEAKQKEEEETARAQEELQRQQVEELRRAEDAKKNAGLCDNCAAPLFGKLALDLYDKRCCGAACVLALRRKLAADAAMKRFQGTGK